MNVQEQLLKLFPFGGWFVEAGAHDGVGDSQTYELEKAGWKGLCVEPSSAYKGLTMSRKCHLSNRVLWVADEVDILYREMKGEAIELSGIVDHFNDAWDREMKPHKDTFKKTARLGTLLSLVGAPSTIKFLCLDTEGSELDILMNHDFSEYLFLVVLVEYNKVETRKGDLMLLMAGQGYLPYEDDGVNLLFVHRSAPIWPT